MEQLLRVAAANLQTVSFAERRMIEPLSCDTHVLERKVNRVQNPVGAGLQNDFCQSLRPKISTRRNVEIIPQIVRNRMLRLWTVSQSPRYAIVNPPNIAWQGFPKVTKN